MSDLPYLRLHPRDFFSDPDFIAMTNEQAGAYMRLFCMAWLSDPTGTLPDDDERLAALCQCNAMAWRGMKVAVMRPFRLIEGRWHHPLQRRELEATTQYRERQSNNARQGWERRKGMPPHESGNATAMPPSPSPSPSLMRAPKGEMRGIPNEAAEGLRLAVESEARRTAKRTGAPA